MKRTVLWALAPAVALCGCTHQLETKNDINLKPIEVKPVHITLDVNVKVKVDKALDSSFNEVDQAAAGKPGELTPVMAEPAGKPGELTPVIPDSTKPEIKPVNPVKAAAIARIKERLSQINDFKVRGILGESNAGFLGLIKADAAAKKLAEAENGDRWIIYQEIAKQKNTTPEMVAKRRALKNVARAAAGVWIQSPDGSWRQKTPAEAERDQVALKTAGTTSGQASPTVPANH